MLSSFGERGGFKRSVLLVIGLVLQTNLSAQMSGAFAQRSGTAQAIDAARLLAVQGSHAQAVDALRALEAGSGPSAESKSLLGMELYRIREPAQSLDAFSAMLKFRQPDADELRFVVLDYLALHDLPSADHLLQESTKRVCCPAHHRPCRSPLGRDHRALVAVPASHAPGFHMDSSGKSLHMVLFLQHADQIR